MKTSRLAHMLRAASIAATAAVALMALSTFPADAADATVVFEVSIDKMKFEPAHLKVKAGSTVLWVNREKRNNHSILFEQEGLEESERLFPGESWQRRFDTPGMYPYVCGPHPEMRGEIEVIE